MSSKLIQSELVLPDDILRLIVEIVDSASTALNLAAAASKPLRSMALKICQGVVLPGDTISAAKSYKNPKLSEKKRKFFCSGPSHRFFFAPCAGIEFL
jgi:hypothetical protein